MLSPNYAEVRSASDPKVILHSTPGGGLLGNDERDDNSWSMHLRLLRGIQALATLKGVFTCAEEVHRTLKECRPF